MEREFLYASNAAANSNGLGLFMSGGEMLTGITGGNLED
jgi:hypothetical protein